MSEAQQEALREFEDHVTRDFTGFVSNQTQRVYDWEDAVFTECYVSYLSLDDCRTVVSEVWKYLGLTIPEPKISDGRGAKYARAWGSLEIHLPRWSRNFSVVLHEVSHCITDLIDSDDSYDHSGVYVYVYLKLISKIMGHKYSELEKSAQDYGIRVKPVKLGYRLKAFKQPQQPTQEPPLA